jgi:phosphoribosyl 1,2-cyclic phosphate phosphodiesterase
VQLTFLGTAAAEGYPALWCRCERCVTARQRGGRNLRLRASLLINDDLLIDPGPDVLAAAIRLGVDLAPVQVCLVTHPHTDHLESSTFFWRRKGFVATPLPLLRVHASAAAIDRLLRLERRELDPAALRISTTPIGAFQRFELTTGGEPERDPRFEDWAAPETARRRYEVWTFAASHAEPSVEPMFFAVRQVDGPEVSAGGRTLLYATDSGPWSEETWRALERLGGEGVRFDVTAIDSTSGLGKDSTAHMNLRQMAWHQDELGKRGLLNEGARRLAHHFSHNGTPPYEELVEHLRPMGIESAYDGMVLGGLGRVS